MRQNRKARSADLSRIVAACDRLRPSTRRPLRSSSASLATYVYIAITARARSSPSWGKVRRPVRPRAPRFPLSPRISPRELLDAWRLTRPTSLGQARAYLSTDRPIKEQSTAFGRDERARQASAKWYLRVWLHASTWYQNALGDISRWHLQPAGRNVLRSSAEKMG